MLYKTLAAGVIAFGLPTFASATLIFTTSMGTSVTNPGFLSTIKYTDGKLEVINNQTSVCGVNPSWLEFAGDHIYCLDEVWASGSIGSLYNFQVTRDGTNLTQIKKLDTLGGPVSTVRYGKSLKGLAIAAYAGGGFQSFDISNPAAPKAIQNSTFTISQKPGSGAQQKTSHPHEVILDPTGDFIAAPDLGADLIRIFKVDKNTLKYVESKPVPTPDQSGPRHGAFVKLDSGTYFYVVTELSNQIIGWKVNYKTDTLDFGEKLFIIPTHGPNTSVPPGTAASELVISPDSKFLLVASRNETTSLMDIPNPEDKAAGQIKSDPIINYAIQSNGTISFQQVFGAGGKNPRHFSLSKDGSLVLTALQDDGRVALIKRDVQTGKLTEFIGAVHLGGLPTSAKFKEDTNCA